MMSEVKYTILPPDGEHFLVKVKDTTLKNPNFTGDGKMFRLDTKELLDISVGEPYLVIVLKKKLELYEDGTYKEIVREDVWKLMLVQFLTKRQSVTCSGCEGQYRYIFKTTSERVYNLQGVQDV